ncbi:toxin-antitoxin system HicB family antitoxin [Fodinicola acaciae]|uniref:toxin-antitoxin system HicB family antitoxin n=1 Tax=Fodinicola acaciae TaxID=2681555 RepID=UPI0013D7966A|nr:toxin-antitoxin system HicB family antitoxin [Fodinicola acaciae]
MDLNIHIDNLRRELVAVANTGNPEIVKAGELLAKAVESAARLGLIEVLSDAAEEVTGGLAAQNYPAEVQVRIRGREVEMAVTPPMTPPPTQEVAEQPAEPEPDANESYSARFTLRMPEQVKAHVEQAAAADGMSVNAWIVRAIRSWRPEHHGHQGHQYGQHGGWEDWTGGWGKQHGRKNSRITGYSQG